MLEEVGLRLRRASECCWTVLPMDRESPLGSASWTGRRTSSWAFWRRPILEVREHIDEPLVFRVHARWSWYPRYDVYDAEELHVGVISSASVSLRGGRRALCQGSNGNHWFEDDAKHILGTAKEQCLEFTAHIRDDPFLKMLLLGWFLVESDEVH